MLLMAQASSSSLSCPSFMLVASEQFRLFRNGNAGTLAVLANQQFDEVGDAAVLQLRRNAHCFLEVRIDSQIKGSRLHVSLLECICVTLKRRCARMTTADRQKLCSGGRVSIVCSGWGRSPPFRPASDSCTLGSNSRLAELVRIKRPE